MIFKKRLTWQHKDIDTGQYKDYSFCFSVQLHYYNNLTPSPVGTSSDAPFYNWVKMTLSLTYTHTTFNTVNLTHQWQSSSTDQDSWINLYALSPLLIFILQDQTNSTDYRYVMLITAPSILTIISIIVLSYYRWLYNLENMIHDFAIITELDIQMNGSVTDCEPNSHDDRAKSSVTLFTGRNYA